MTPLVSYGRIISAAAAKQTGRRVGRAESSTHGMKTAIARHRHRSSSRQGHASDALTHHSQSHSEPIDRLIRTNGDRFLIFYALPDRLRLIILPV